LNERPSNRPLHQFSLGDRIANWLLLSVGIVLMPAFILVEGAVLLVTSPIWVPIWTVRKVRRITGGHPIYWTRAKLGWGRSVEDLAGLLDRPADELANFQPSYVEAFLRKRKGGTRRLLVPDEATKTLQRLLLHRVFAGLKSHPAAMGFEKGRSIVDNALPHVGRAVVIQMDVQDFFPSTTADRVEAYFRRIGWNRQAAAVLARLTTHEGGLPQGAPTSPRLSNLVNYGIDERLARFAKRRKGHYTRYADDITFSFPKDYPKRVRGVIQKTRHILKANGYTLHERRKLHIRRRHQRQIVTGLVVNERVNLPRRQRRRLRAAMHRHRTGGDPTWTLQQLQGWAALLAMIDKRGCRD
jgi:RNA-directed DNA polymerase